MIDFNRQNEMYYKCIVCGFNNVGKAIRIMWLPEDEAKIGYSFDISEGDKDESWTVNFVGESKPGDEIDWYVPDEDDPVLSKYVFGSFHNINLPVVTDTAVQEIIDKMDVTTWIDERFTNDINDEIFVDNPMIQRIIAAIQNLAETIQVDGILTLKNAELLISAAGLLVYKALKIQAEENYINFVEREEI